MILCRGNSVPFSRKNYVLDRRKHVLCRRSKKSCTGETNYPVQGKKQCAVSERKSGHVQKKKRGRVEDEEMVLYRRRKGGQALSARIACSRVFAETCLGLPSLADQRREAWRHGRTGFSLQHVMRTLEL